MKTMKTMRILAAAVLAVCGGLVFAQGGPGAASAPAGMASGPMMGGRGMGPHAASRLGQGASSPSGMMGGRGMGPRAGRGNTYGWAMMSPEERREHQARMRSMTNYDECRGYQEQHHQEMVERAKQRGVNAPAQPRRDACAALKR